ncbi:DUF4350 domain-containing protein [Marinitenerispora sediminis]|uniref:DUF4350 domain-containing protein n=1 Tax=Marinitenerispora sediminis TaxID=1931232 RepID=A0A368T378_9ACTN|nr:DUF4350 domain-containing protein [Marinitenerispora sediminis]RCV55701.1 DUF4350 domain-containing protein [Marinitenerispora sediminis]RCV56722.1 DUF4350 domain-containing protein [Marinitenerispora sediminis]RCV56751.1 DUF4350 domain-containing protein [Marinitenerispora sediminis]
MSVTTPSTDAASPAPGAAPAAASGVLTASPGDLWRRTRGPLAFLALLIVVAVVLSLGSRPLPAGDLDPEAPSPDGSRALVQLLGERGADVTVARDTDAALAAAGPDSVLVLVQSHRLLPEEVDRLAAAPGDRLLVQPTSEVLAALAPGVSVSGRVDAGTLRPECRLPAAVAAGGADTGGEVYTAAGPGAAACYPADSGHALVRVPGESGGTVTVLGTGEPLRNSRIGRLGNAALGLNLLAGRDVVWFDPDVREPSGEASLWELLPRAVYLGAGQLGVAVLLLALWRGRRLGPLVAERIPSVVRAAETTEGRAGLYAERRARDRAAAALRDGFLGRNRPLLGLGPDAAPEAVVEAVAARTGADPRRLGALLYGPLPPGGADPYDSDDAGLVRLADELDRLEGELR